MTTEKFPPKNNMTLNQVYKFYVEGEMSEGDFKDVLKEKGYTVIIEGSSKYKYGMMKGMIYAGCFFILLFVVFYFLSIVIRM